MGFVIWMTAAMLMAAIAKRFDNTLRPVKGAMIAFVGSAFIGTLLFVLVYPYFVADEQNRLNSRAAVEGFLAGLLIIPALVGWLGARWLAKVWTRDHPDR